MKTALNLNLGQSLTLTPQLQQAIRLLQLSTMELSQEIQQAIETNPMLEMETPSDANPVQEKAQAEAGAQDVQTKDVEKDVSVDTQWEDVSPSYANSSSYSDDFPNLENTQGTEYSLQNHLTWQMELTPFSDLDRSIATIIIDSINDSGFLHASLEDIQQALTQDAQTDEYLNVEFDEIEAVLHRIQRFDPIGVGARNLSECLLRQLEALPATTPYFQPAKVVIEKHLEALGQRNFNQIMRQCRLSQSDLSEVLKLIQSFNPHPGEQIAQTKTEYVIPDVVVTQQGEHFYVELNGEALPKLRVNQQYAQMIQRANNSSDNTFLKNNLQEARWFIKSLQSRQDTLLRVASTIVKQQQAFFLHGEEAMKPMILHDIASSLDLHESTISRVTTNKYMHTPRGVFELKYFFSSHVGTTQGGECSSTAIRAIIKKLVAAENQSKPLSDQKIAQILQEQGIKVARRTIAKYREAMNIAPSNERKSLLSNN